MEKQRKNWLNNLIDTPFSQNCIVNDLSSSTDAIKFISLMVNDVFFLDIWFYKSETNWLSFISHEYFYKHVMHWCLGLDWSYGWCILDLSIWCPNKVGFFLCIVMHCLMYDTILEYMWFYQYSLVQNVNILK